MFLSRAGLSYEPWWFRFSAHKLIEAKKRRTKESHKRVEEELTTQTLLEIELLSISFNLEQNLYCLLKVRTAC